MELGQALSNAAPDQAPDDLLIVEDDDAFRERLTRAMEKRGFAVRAAPSVRAGLNEVTLAAPDYAVVDLRLEDGNGLDVVDAIHAAKPKARAIVLTGYGNVPTAVAAVKAGAADYLPKPVTADEIEAALTTPDGARPQLRTSPANPNDVRRQHIKDVMARLDNNLSETARQLQMHRRTLQRIINRDRKASEGDHQGE